MPKVKISEYSATANSNTDVASINIDEGCAPSGINNAIRAVMGHLKDFQQGTNGDPFNGPHNGTVGATTPASGAFTTLSATGNVTLGDASTDTLNVGNGGLIKDASGNVGVGVTPSTINQGKGLEIFQAGYGLWNGTASTYVMANAYFNSGFKYGVTGQQATTYYQYQGTHVWNTAASGTAGNAITFTQAMTLDSLGNLGIGTTTPSLENGNGLVVYNSSVPRVAFRNSTTGTTSFDGTDLALVNSDFYIFNRESGAILLATGGTERARIDSSGNLLVGTTSGNSNQYTAGSLNLGGSIVTAGYKYCVISYNTGGSGAALSFQKAGTEKAAMFYNESDSRLYVFNGGSAFGVYMSTNATSWTANSDERLKTDLVPIENAAQKVSTLRAVTGRYKTDEEGISRSFLIAQDVQAVLPEAVDASDPEKLGVQYTDVIPLLVAAIQEQQALITTLTARITALESA